MPRGKASQVGDTHVNANGYHNTRTEEGWRFTHHLIAEKQLGRRLSEDETVRFKDSDRSNLDPANLEVRLKKRSVGARRAQLQAKILELQAELEALEEEESDSSSLVKSSSS